MKRMICLILSIIFLFLTSCEDLSLHNGQTEFSGPAALVEQEIAKLPSPIYDDENDTFIIALKKAEENYAKLSDEEKREVKNYNLLLLAREIYNFDWVKKQAEEKMKNSVCEKLSDPSSLKIDFPHIYLYKSDERIYVLVIFDYFVPNSMGGYEEKSETAHYLFLPDKEKQGYDYGSEIDYDTYREAVREAMYYRRPKWK